jgi:hypothetical protein
MAVVRFGAEGLTAHRENLAARLQAAADEERRQAETENALAYLSVRRDRLTDLGTALELEYERTTDPKKKRALLRQMLTADQQTYTTQIKIDKLTGK